MSEKIEDDALFKRYSDVMDRNIKGVQIGCYSIAFIGLTYALRKVRPFSRFKKPSDIPKRFIKERRELQGTVERIEPNGTLLINHKPLISLPGIKEGELPVKIARVNVNGHGISWLQTLVAGNEVRFIPISKNDNFVECEVKMQQKIRDKKNKIKDGTIDLGVSLVKIEFASLLDPPIPIKRKDPNYKYYTKLISAREDALRKKMGLKYYVKPTKIIIASLLSSLKSITYALIKKIGKKRLDPLPKAIAA